MHTYKIITESGDTNKKENDKNVGFSIIHKTIDEINTILCVAIPLKQDPPAVV